MANLAYGSSGSDVRKLQQELKKAGYNIAADGVFGAETQAAVEAYQRANGLGVDGIAGNQTLGSLGITTPDPTKTSYYTGNSGKYQLGATVGGSTYPKSGTAPAVSPASYTGMGGVSTGLTDYWNEGLTAAQVAEMQRYYGTDADGLWGPNSTNAAGGLSAQQAWEKYQQSSGNTSGRNTTGTGNGWYDNEGLFEDQIKALQRYYGTADDGKWGANSMAAAGGATAQQAWAAYVQEMMNAQKEQNTTTEDVLGFEDFYERMGGAEYEQKIRDAINASVQRAVDAYNAQRVDTEQDASEMARQAYVAKLLGEKNMAQRLAASGYAGGMAESAMLESEANYQNQLAEIQRQRQRALDEIQRAIDNARLTGDMEMAEQMTAYMAQVQSYYSDYYDQMLNQQMQQAQAAASKAAASAVTPSVTPAGVVASPNVANPGGGITAQVPSFSNVKRSIAGALQTGNPTQAATLVTQVWGSASEAQRQELRNLMNAAGYNIAG